MDKFHRKVVGEVAHEIDEKYSEKEGREIGTHDKTKNDDGAIEDLKEHEKRKAGGVLGATGVQKPV